MQSQKENTVCFILIDLNKTYRYSENIYINLIASYKLHYCIIVFHEVLEI